MTRRPSQSKPPPLAGGNGCSLSTKAIRLVITADGFGSNALRVRLWKRELQHLTDEIGIAVEIIYLPPGTSKRNQIEQKLLSFISPN